MRSVGLFTTCLVETMRPSVGLAAVRLLRQCGLDVSIPASQTCCAQPGYNNGDSMGAFKVARQVIRLFMEFDYVVAPSGSCLAMLKHHYPQLVQQYGNSEDKENVQYLSTKCWELVSFLHQHESFIPKPLQEQLNVTCHDSCSSLRELGISYQVRDLLQKQHNISLVEMHKTEVCCGFGGTFCLKNAPVSDQMADNKLDAAVATGAEVLLAGDLGCLIHLAGRSSKRKLPLRLRHTAEVLAGFVNLPAIGERGTVHWDDLIQKTIHAKT